MDLVERDGLVRAGVSTVCAEYGVRSGSLVECAGAEVPQVMRLRREADGDYRVVSQEVPPDGEGNAQWLTSRFGRATAASLDDTVPTTTLEASRPHPLRPAGRPVGNGALIPSQSASRRLLREPGERAASASAP
ncbi:hypothetical protein [Streptomyces shaanxiensis]